MADKLKQKIAEFVSLVKECPENLQEKCFSLLLEDYLQQSHGRRPAESLGEKPAVVAVDTDKTTVRDVPDPPNKKKAEQKDIAEADLHVKVRQFLNKADLSVDHINQLFYMEENDFLPLYDDLKTTKSSESQIRIALLHALLSAMHKGDFVFDGESVREEAQVRKCYDAPNFATNFKNNRGLFDGFQKYSKTEPLVRLSRDGKDKLAEVIRDLQ